MAWTAPCSLRPDGISGICGRDLLVVHDFRIDQYGIRGVTELDRPKTKVEFVRETRIELEEHTDAPLMYPYSMLTVSSRRSSSQIPTAATTGLLRIATPSTWITFYFRPVIFPHSRSRRRSARVAATSRESSLWFSKSWIVRQSVRERQKRCS